MPESMGAKIFFIYCFPMLALFKYSIIDVRKKKWTNYYPITMVTTVVWLAFMAEGMMTGAETAGCIMEIPEDVMGLTVAAAGTSLPNLFASLIVAKQGLGNMSVSNAFGSNTFNIFIALAVSAGTHKQQPTATHSTAQHSTAQHSTAQHSTAQQPAATHSNQPHGLCCRPSPPPPPAVRQAYSPRPTAEQTTKPLCVRANSVAAVGCWRFPTR
jgi:hypothetical protein